jgi:hypothetical protein
MDDTIRRIIDAAKSLAPVIEALTGTALVGPAVAAGQAILNLIDGVKDASGQSQEELEAARTELEAKVNAHVDATVKRLEGE